MSALLADERRAAVDAVLEKSGYRFAIVVMLLCGFGWISDGAEGVVLSYMLPTLETVWHVSHAEQAVLATSQLQS